MVQLTMVAMQNPPVAASSSPVSRVIELHPDTSMTNLEFLQQLDPKLAEFNRKLQRLTDDVMDLVVSSPDFVSAGLISPRMSPKLFQQILNMAVDTIIQEVLTWPELVYPSNSSTKRVNVGRLVRDMLYEMGSKFEPYLVGEESAFDFAPNGQKNRSQSYKEVLPSAYEIAQDYSEKILVALGYHLSGDQFLELGEQLQEDAVTESVEIVIRTLKVAGLIDPATDVPNILKHFMDTEKYQSLRTLLLELIKIKYPPDAHEWQLDCFRKFIPENQDDFQAFKDRSEDLLDDTFSELIARTANLTWKVQQVFRALIEGAFWRIEVVKPLSNAEQDYSSRGGLIVSTFVQMRDFIKELKQRVDVQVAIPEDELNMILTIMSTSFDMHKDLSGVVFSRPEELETSQAFALAKLLDNSLVPTLISLADRADPGYLQSVLEGLLLRFAHEKRLRLMQVKTEIANKKDEVIARVLQLHGNMEKEVLEQLRSNLERVLSTIKG